MKIEKVSIDSIKVYPNNAKIHTAEQIEEIKKSIQEFGNNDPIAIDEKGFIIEGEGRYLAQKDMGLKEIEVIKLTHLSEEQKVAYMLVHNKLTMNTGFDIDILEEELAKISNIDMQEFEFDIKQLEEELENEVNTSSESSFNYKEQYGVIVICKNEEDQEKVYNKLLDGFSKLDFDIYYITLYLSDESLYEKRLQREGKVEPKYAKFNVSNSIKQQNTYLEMSKEIKEKYSSIKTIEIDNSKNIEEVKKILKEFINF